MPAPQPPGSLPDHLTDPSGATIIAGDPEAALSAQASRAMEPVTGPYLHDVVTGQYAAQGLQNINETFARAQAGDVNALGDLAGMFGPGATNLPKVYLPRNYLGSSLSPEPSPSVQLGPRSVSLGDQSLVERAWAMDLMGDKYMPMIRASRNRNRQLEPYDQALYAQRAKQLPPKDDPSSLGAVVSPGLVAGGAAAGQTQAEDPKQAYFNAATQAMTLTPQEQYLYQHHLRNLWGNGRVDQPNGDISTMLQAVVTGPDGRFYNIPTVWSGQVVPVPIARQMAEAAGWENWPAYPTPEAADARYEGMHQYIDQDTVAYRNSLGQTR
jgi:hypothetical protein